MGSKFNPNFDGENVGDLQVAITKEWAKLREPPDMRDRIIRAPLVHRTVHMTEEREIEDDGSRPDESVTLSLPNIFEHLKEAAACLNYMHKVLGQLHFDISPDNLLMHYGKDGKIVYLLNDFDSGYAGRLAGDMYGDKAMAYMDADKNLVWERYEYKDLQAHLQSLSKA